MSAPQLPLPKGGGAVRGIGEKFAANPVTGTGSMSVPIALSPGRGGFGPQLALSYDSGAGQGAFAMGWQLPLPSISHKMDKGLPRHLDDEDAGPQFVFADGTQTIFLADMCGDGLTALVRIRNGGICYWPNLGYGRSGRKVTLGNSPRFDHSDLYDPRRIRLTDIDGSGPVDIIYLGRNGAQLYFNRTGNSLSDALLVDLPVATENLGAVQAADLLGNGTACLVWNHTCPPMRATPYVTST